MDERNIWPSVTIVALIAGAVTALLYTSRGRHALRRFDEALDDFGSSLQQLRGAVQRQASLPRRVSTSPPRVFRLCRP